MNLISSLRLHYSLFYLPVFFFALGLTPNLNETRLLWVFLILHLLVYPSNNLFSTYYSHQKNESEGSPNKNALFRFGLVLLVISILLSFKISGEFASMVAVFSLGGIVFTHPSLAIKKSPWMTYLIKGTLQGYFAFAMAYAGLSDFGWGIFGKSHVLIPGITLSMMYFGYYPLAEIYLKSNQKSSLKQGILGTFLLSAFLFTLSGAGFAWFFIQNGQQDFLWTFLGAMTPMMLYFLVWFNFIRVNPEKYASKSWVRGMVSLSVIIFNGFSFYFFLENTQILQLFAY
ncbi:ubiquinone biosynthesis protein UbiA [Algoriphagus sp. CAU 1675]|uniref:ubiquinone biosynthesis protein UbiA n=1 Tax=Algoriphagus sp. CAU 1675 TaxID=3032597 RepID=UPI0023DC25C6|nr:ubiquinone biosynthesis protein UbiA [Algoriphagus sp. CAU 1675]MDF2156230.1 ubiquinone biosynthesis protein UbiA [Algoriphagus sp. CAU 1675]